MTNEDTPGSLVDSNLDKLYDAMDESLDSIQSFVLRVYYEIPEKSSTADSAYYRAGFAGVLNGIYRQNPLGEDDAIPEMILADLVEYIYSEGGGEPLVAYDHGGSVREIKLSEIKITKIEDTLN